MAFSTAPLILQRTRRLVWCALVLAVVMVLLAFLRNNTHKEPPPPPSPAQPTTTQPAAAPPASRPPQDSGTTTSPSWSSLSVAQRAALLPLQNGWDTIPSRQKKRWLVLVEGFEHKSNTEQALMHSRMAEWAALTPVQRNQARLNFATIQDVPASNRTAKWEEYQALSEEEKKKLAESAHKPPKGGAVAVKPIPTEKLTPLPPPKPASEGEPETTARQPKILTSPDLIDPVTLLPQIP